ncbi:MAG: alpha/beta fold hydrolase [Alphaproteobacteria bacterium]
MKKLLAIVASLASLVMFGCDQQATKVANDIPGADPVIPFDLLLEGNVYDAPKISPDGSQIVVLGKVDGVSNLMIAPANNPAALTPLTHDTDRGFQAMTIWSEQAFRWMPNNTHIVYIRDEKGDENWTLYSLEVATGKTLQLTPAEGMQARGARVSAAFPNEVLIGLNDEHPVYRNYYRINVATGEKILVSKGEPFFSKMFDNNFEERIAVTIINEKRDFGVFRKVGDDWQILEVLTLEDATALASNHLNNDESYAFSEDNNTLYLFSSVNLNTNALVQFDLTTGTQSVVAVEDTVDVKEALVHPSTFAPQAYIKHFTMKDWVLLDDSLQADFDFLHNYQDGELRIESRDAADQNWVVSFVRADFPTTYYLYKRADKSVTELWNANKKLAALPLADLYPTVIKSSDGYDLVSYITYPTWIKVDEQGVPERPVPTVIVIHGGPSDERMIYAYAPLLQWLTNRGYAVYAVNFRGSPGFGKAFVNAQNLEWGGAMHRDIMEQLDHVIAKGMVDADKVGVLGGSYGGYATLVAMTMTPDRFACGVDVVGPANLETFIDPETAPPGWTVDSWAPRLGDPRTEEGLKLIRERSPFNHAHKTQGDMLIIQGDNDIRVPTRESDQMVAAMKAAGVDVTYLGFPDEGHGLIRRENNSAFMAVTEVFLGECLGGRYEPLGDKLKGSSAEAREGVEHIPGLAEALAANNPVEGE